MSGKVDGVIESAISGAGLGCEFGIAVKFEVFMDVGADDTVGVISSA